MPDNAAGIDFESLMQDDDASAFVLDDDDESGGMEPEGRAAPETYSQAQSWRCLRPALLIPPGHREPWLFPTDSSADMLDQVLQEYDPLVDEHFKVKKTGSKSTTTLLLIVLLVCSLGGGAYYYFMMREPEAPEPVVPVKIAKAQKQDAVLDKVLRKEPLPAQQQTADNATQEHKKPGEAKPAQTVEKKTEAPIVVEQQHAAVQPVEPAVPSKMPEKAAPKGQAPTRKNRVSPSAPRNRARPLGGSDFRR